MKEPKIGSTLESIGYSKSPDGPIILKFSDGTCLEVYTKEAKEFSVKVKMVRDRDEMWSGGH